MSISSILAFVFAGAAALKAKPDRRDENRQELIALRVDNADLRRRVDELTIERDELNAQIRRDQDVIDTWRARAFYAEMPDGAAVPVPVPQMSLYLDAQRRARNAQAALVAYANAQHNQMAAQQNLQMAAQQNLAAYQNQGLLGAQTFDPQLWCNCVPARHDLFIRGE
jgi:hypothetical protein